MYMPTRPRRPTPEPPPPSTAATPEDERPEEREDGLDRTIEDTFPASDPLSSIPDPPLPPRKPARKRR
jgi:hypothetical protein